MRKKTVVSAETAVFLLRKAYKALAIADVNVILTAKAAG